MALPRLARHCARARPFSTRQTQLWPETVGVGIHIKDEPGALHRILQIFKENSVNLTSLKNQMSPLPPHLHLFQIHFEGSWEGSGTMEVLRKLKPEVNKIFKLPEPTVPWFPRKVQDIDQFSRSTLDAGTDLESDHPGFNDPAYRERRTVICNNASSFSTGSLIPEVAYTPEENGTWTHVWDQLTALYPRRACREQLAGLKEMQEAGIYARERIPQLQHISDHLKQKTGFTLRPVTGLLSARDFLAALAFRVFFSTQYIRHHSEPMYTPEPDVIHELLGHVPMFTDPDFADFTQYIGMASLGASDEEVKRLATNYWFSVEFGLLWESGEIRGYGAGVLSSFGELMHATSPTNSKIEIRPFDPFAACHQDYPITKLQPVYFAASSLADAKAKMKTYADQVDRPFHVKYIPETECMVTDKKVFSRPVGLKFTPVYPEMQELLL